MNTCYQAPRAFRGLLKVSDEGPLTPWSEAVNKCNLSWLGRADSSTFPVELLKSSRETLSIWYPILLEKNSTVRG
jgi:hypothetical protein